MEPLSDVLASLKPQASHLHALDAAGEWSIQFPAYEGVKFDAIRKGACWLRVDEEESPLRFSEGDCFLLTTGKSFSLANNPSLPAAPRDEVLKYDPSGIAFVNGGGCCFTVGAHFIFSGDYVGTLFGLLPPVVPVLASSEEAQVLRSALEIFEKEIRKDEPGKMLTAEHLAQIMLIQVLRIYLRSDHATGTGWLHALRDPQIGASLCAMHTDIGRRWTIEEIARVAGMSRSSFADKFKRAVGASPLEYLTRWRIHVAEDLLKFSDRSIAAIAKEVGYESEGGFGTVFRKINGCAPGRFRYSAYRNRANQTSESTTAMSGDPPQW